MTETEITEAEARMRAEIDRLREALDGMVRKWAHHGGGCCVFDAAGKVIVTHPAGRARHGVPMTRPRPIVDNFPRFPIDIVSARVDTTYIMKAAGMESEMKVARVGSGWFSHYTADGQKTLCGKPVSGLVSSTSASCHSCQVKVGERHAPYRYRSR